MTGTITWEERDGDGSAVLRYEDGVTLTAPLSEPIAAATDSHAVAALFGCDFLAVEHDREHIHVTIEDDEDETPHRQWDQARGCWEDEETTSGEEWAALHDGIGDPVGAPQ